MARARGQDSDGLRERLEGELRDTRSRLQKVESDLQQSRKQAWSLEADIRRLSEAQANAGSSTAQLSTLREEIRQMRDQMGRLQDRLSATANRTEEALRLRSVGGGREGQDLSGLSRQLEGFARDLGQFEGRLHLVEDANRRAEEDIAGLRLSGQAVDRLVEEVGGRANRSQDISMRLEQDVSRNSGAVDNLRKMDEALDDRINVVLEQSRRLGERVDKLDEFLNFPSEARELLQHASAERDIMVQRIALMEKLNGELTERLQQFSHSVSKLEQRQQVQTAQVMDLAGKVQETAEQMQAQMKRWMQLLLRQRRRQMDSLAQEIKELAPGEHQNAE